nr:4Fe-4S dicluster domain-containing protein [Candidatus Sigynarchaeota archaeon]
LFEYEIDGKDITVKPSAELDGKKNIVFGIRPCDAKSFTLLGNFFDFGTFKDDLFQKKREMTVLVGIGCNEPRSTCFCTSVDGAPHDARDVDVFLVDLGNRYLIKTVTDQGAGILHDITWLGDASKADLILARELAEKARRAIKETVDLSHVAKILDDNFYNEIWDEISATCLGCGACSYFCPTCHCFDVIDENDYSNKKGRRMRVWDTCQSSLFTLHTSGHNPRVGQKERCRQRTAHKFCYYPENYNLAGCVGCGRCIMVCPVNNDIREIIVKINNVAFPKKEVESIE